MILSVFITVISGHDKPQPPGCLLGHKDSYNQKTIVSDDIRNIIRRMSDDSSVSSYINDVFYLYSTGISHNAIARILNISISTSKKHASLICDYFSVSKEGANKRGNSSRLTQSFHFFMFEPIFSPVNALNQPI